MDQSRRGRSWIVGRVSRRSPDAVSASGVTSSSGFGFNVAVGRYADKTSRASYTVWENALVNWLTVEAPFGALMSLHLHGGFASGHVKKQNNFDTAPYVDEDRWVMLGGATLEIHR